MADSTLGLESYEPSGAAGLSEEERLAAPDDACVTDAPIVSIAPPVVERVKARPRYRAVSVNPFGMTQADLQRYAVVGIVFLLALVFLSQVVSILPPFIIAFSSRPCLTRPSATMSAGARLASERSC